MSEFVNLAETAALSQDLFKFVPRLRSLPFSSVEDDAEEEGAIGVDLAEQDWQLGMLGACDGKYCGRLRFYVGCKGSSPRRPLASVPPRPWYGAVSSSSSSGTSAVADDCWIEVYAVLDALNLSLYSDDFMHTFLLRFDAYAGGKSAAGFGGGVFGLSVLSSGYLSVCQPCNSSRVITTYKIEETASTRPADIDGLRQNSSSCTNRTYFFDAGSGIHANRWVEALYFVRASRPSWSLTEWPRVERFLCCCTSGNDIVQTMSGFGLWNFLFLVPEIISACFDLVEEHKASASGEPSLAGLYPNWVLRVTLLNNVVNCIALALFFCVLHSNIRMHTVLKLTRRLCVCLVIMHLTKVIFQVYVWLFNTGDRSAVVSSFWKRLTNWTDVLNVCLWLNGLYYCIWAEHLIDKDITTSPLVQSRELNCIYSRVHAIKHAPSLCIHQRPS